MNPPYLPESAPFSNEQRAWLNGLLAGMFSATTNGSPAQSNTAADSVIPLTILYGSQSGNGEALAKQFAKTAGKSGFQAKAIDMGDYQSDRLSKENHLLLICSTYGDGEPPDTARALHSYLLSDKASKLENMKYSVLGLGDSSYPDFNQCAIEFDQRLAELGAKRVCDSKFCDVDFEEPAEVWFKNGLAALKKSSPAVAVSANQSHSVAEEKNNGELQETPTVYSKKNPYPARILKNINLNGKDSAKETRHLEINLGSSGITYRAGDALGVYPQNCPRLVDNIISASGLPEDAPTPLPNGSIAPLADALRFHYDINRLSSPFVEACARLSKSEFFKDLLADKGALQSYLDGRSILDPISGQKVEFPGTEMLIAPLKKLQPRVYSISSSPLVHPGEVHLTVGCVRWQAHGLARKGVCSNFLADISEGGRLSVFVQPNQNFRPPQDADTPMIMAGPGTGIAPFRAFLQERSALGHKGKNWLFFGDQTSKGDFLYADELKYWQKRGILTRLSTAFSRDQQEKIYVQNRMQENASTLYQWLEQGACFYVCGDASRMAKDVENTLLEIIANESGKGQDHATAYLKTMRSEKRYLRDVY